MKKRGYSRRLNDKQKAEIVLRKAMRKKGDSAAKIAEDFQTSTSTVEHLGYTTLTPMQKEIYEKKKAKLKELALDATTTALVKGMDLMELADTAKHLAGVAAMGKFADSVYRLETGQPTEIVRNMSTEDHALEFIKVLRGRMDREEAIEAFKRSSLEPLITEQRRLEIAQRIERGELKLLGE